MKRRTIFVVMSVVLVLIGAGVAFAYFRPTGSGSGQASTGTLQAVTVTAFVGADSPNSVLVPGATADVIVRVNNPNPFAVTLVTVTGNGTITADASHSACSPTGVTFTNQSGLSRTIGASGTTLVHLDGAASMSTSAANACQGATFTVPVTITVHTS